jgi:hypothetical protein
MKKVVILVPRQRRIGTAHARIARVESRLFERILERRSLRFESALSERFERPFGARVEAMVGALPNIGRLTPWVSPAPRPAASALSNIFPRLKFPSTAPMIEPV